MKFNLNHDPNNKTLAIPRAALQLSGLAGVSDLILHTDSGCILLLPGDPTVSMYFRRWLLGRGRCKRRNHWISGGRSAHAERQPQRELYAQHPLHQ